MRPPRILALVLCFAVAVSVWAQTPVEKWKAAVAAAESLSKDGGDPVPQLREAVTLAETFGTKDVRLLESLNRLADHCSYDEESCRDGEGKGLLQRALSLRSGISPQDTHYMDALLELGSIASAYGEYRDALLVYGETRDLQEKAFGPTDVRVAKTYARISRVYSWQKDRAQARRTLDYALEVQDRAGKRKSEAYADLLAASAELLRDQEEKQKAEAEVRRAADTYRQIWSSRDSRRADGLRSLVWISNSSNLQEELYKEVAGIRKAAQSERSAEYNTALCDLGRLYQRQKRLPEAARSYEEAIRIREAAQLRDEHLIRSMEGLASVRGERSEHREAAALYERSFAIRQSLHQAPATLMHAWTSVVAAYADAGDLVTAESKFEAMLNEGRLRAPYALVQAAEKLGETYAKSGDPMRAVEKFEIATGTFEATAGADHPAMSSKLIRLSRAYQEAGRYDDANRVNQRILQIGLSDLGKMAREPGGTGAMLRKAALIVSSVVWSLVIFGAVGYFFLARRMDRKLVKLYEPLPLPLPDPEPAVSGQTVDWESDMAAEPAPVAVMIEPPLPSPPRVQAVEYHGDGGDLFALRVVNLLFSLLTLGVYSFWGKAKVRRYLCGQAEFEGDRFDFHGNGRELFLGWLKGAPLLGFIIFFPSVLPFFWHKIESIVVAQIVAAAAFLLLWPVARAGAYRYRMNRMSWRGIRFSFVGRTLRYFAISVGGYILSALTFGVYVPALFVQQRRLLFNHTSFGTEPFRFEGRTRDLLPVWICALPVLVVTYGLFWPWWSAFRYRYVWANTTLAGARFRCTITGWSLARLWIGNAVLIVATLGLGWSWASIRTLRFWSRGIELVGDLDAAAVQQKQLTSSAVGESFADFLGFDFGF